MKRFIRIDLEYELDSSPLYLVSEVVKRLLIQSGYKVLSLRDTSNIEDLNEPFYRDTK